VTVRPEAQKASTGQRYQDMPKPVWPPEPGFNERLEGMPKGWLPPDYPWEVSPTGRGAPSNEPPLTVMKRAEDI
jgi:hypothetical protein